MHLHREYCKRNKISTPLVYHTKQEYNLLLTNPDANKDYPKFELLKVKWDHSENRLGKYVLVRQKPVHDSVSAGRSVFEKFKDRKDQLEWDEYEEFWMDLAEKRNNGFVIKRNDVSYVLWYMFVYCADSALAGISHISENLCLSIDTSIPIKNRLEYKKKCLLELKNSTNLGLYDQWKSKFSNLENSKNYAYWLSGFTESSEDTEDE